MQYSCLKHNFREFPYLLEQVRHWRLQVSCLVSPSSLTVDHRGVITGNKLIPPLLLPMYESIVTSVRKWSSFLLYGHNVPSKKKAENMGRLTAGQSWFCVWTSHLCRKNFTWNILLFGVDDHVFLVSLLVLPFSTARLVSSDTLFLHVLGSARTGLIFTGQLSGLTPPGQTEPGIPYHVPSCWVPVGGSGAVGTHSWLGSAGGGGSGERLCGSCGLFCVFSSSVSLLLLFPLFAVLLNCPYPDPPVSACFFPFCSAPWQGEGWPHGALLPATAKP